MMALANSIPQPQADVTKPATSLTAKLFNVFTEPGQVFQEVKNSKPATNNWLHVLLAVLNVFNFWLIWVSASGLSHLASAPFSKSLLIVVIYWLAYSLFFIAIGSGQFAL